MGRMGGNIYKDLIWSVTLMSKAGETLDPEDCIKLLEKHCKFLKPSDASYSDFVFTNVLDAIGMVSFIVPAFILLNERYGLKIQDVGAGDVSPKFENKLFIVKHYQEGVVPEYVLQTQTESLIRLASSGVRIEEDGETTDNLFQ